MDHQTTLKGELHFSGVGLHTGKVVNLTILPAAENQGYRFKRMDLPDHPIIPASLQYVNYTVRGTVLEKDGIKVSTTEHLLAALYGMQIDNALIELDGPEVPILDGSALLYVEAIEKIGFIEQQAKREYFELNENIKFEIPDKGIEFLAVPDPEFRVTVMVDYNSPVLGTQHAQMMNIRDFKKEIAHCRTFVFLRELQQLADLGLIKGGDLDNAVVLVDREDVSKEELQILAKKLGRAEDLSINYRGMGLLNSSNLRELNEPARHKLLDIIGDFALIGKPIRAHILAARPGHYGNTEFGKILLEQAKKQARNYKKFNLTSKVVYDINAIKKLLPHRYPFLLVDKIIHLSDDNIVGVKNISIDEPFFAGHFPEEPVMPGVLQLEAMAQTAGILMLSKITGNKAEYSTYFLSIDQVKFRQKVVPGDVLVLDIQFIEPIRRGIAKVSGKAYVNSQLVSEAILMAQLVHNKQ